MRSIATVLQRISTNECSFDFSVGVASGDDVVEQPLVNFCGSPQSIVYIKQHVFALGPVVVWDRVNKIDLIYFFYFLNSAGTQYMPEPGPARRQWGHGDLE